MAKLYPPVIEGTIPAFYGTTLVVPFSMNRAVGKADIIGFSLKVKTVQTNTYVGTVRSTDFNLTAVNFNVESLNLIAGQYYKIQIGYINTDEQVGYYSMVGVTKYYGEVGPQIYIDGLSSKVTNLFSGYNVGVFEHPTDPMEKVAQYKFTIIDDEEEIIYDSGWKIHNTINDVNSLLSTDILKYDNELEDGKPCYLQYFVISSNNMECSSPRYRVLQRNSVNAYLDLTLIGESNYDDGYVTLKLINNSENSTEPLLTGSFEVSRQNIKTPGKWESISAFIVQNEYLSKYSWRDFTVVQGETYIYSIRQFNEAGVYSERILSNEVFVDFEDAFLFDGKRQLKIRYNPKVSSFKNDIPESKTDTIGSKYPFIFRNGHVNYKEFPISGLISYFSDEQELFLTNEEIGITDISDWTREKTPSKDEIPLNAKTTSLTNYNIAAERRFKLEVLEWLTNGEPKLFRSPNEGNYIVRLLNTSLTPTDSLGRMLHSFQCTAYEICDNTYENLVAYRFIKNALTDDEKLKLYYRTVPLYDGIIQGTDRIIYKPDENGYIELLTDPHNPLLKTTAYSIRFDDMHLGDVIYVDGEKRIIGNTGVYSLENLNGIKSVKIMAAQNNGFDEISYNKALNAYKAELTRYNYDVTAYNTAFSRYKNSKGIIAPYKNYLDVETKEYADLLAYNEVYQKVIGAYNDYIQAQQNISVEKKEAYLDYLQKWQDYQENLGEWQAAVNDYNNRTAILATEFEKWFTVYQKYSHDLAAATAAKAQAKITLEIAEKTLEDLKSSKAAQEDIEAAEEVLTTAKTAFNEAYLDEAQKALLYANHASRMPKKSDPDKEYYISEALEDFVENGKPVFNIDEVKMPTIENYPFSTWFENYSAVLDGDETNNHLTPAEKTIWDGGIPSVTVWEAQNYWQSKDGVFRKLNELPEPMSEDIVNPKEEDYYYYVSNDIMNDSEGIFTYSYKDTYANDFDLIAGQSLEDVPLKQFNGRNVTDNLVNQIIDTKTELVDVLRLQVELKEIEDIYAYQNTIAPSIGTAISKQDFNNMFSFDRALAPGETNKGNSSPERAGQKFIPQGIYLYKIHPIFSHDRQLDTNEIPTNMEQYLVELSPWEDGQTEAETYICPYCAKNSPNPTLYKMGNKKLVVPNYATCPKCGHNVIDYRRYNFNIENGEDPADSHVELIWEYKNGKWYGKEAVYHKNEQYYMDMLYDKYYTFDDGEYYLVYDENTEQFIVEKDYCAKLYLNTGVTEGVNYMDNHLFAPTGERLQPYLDMTDISEFKTTTVPYITDLYVGNALILNLSYQTRKVLYSLESVDPVLKNKKAQYDNLMKEYTSQYYTENPNIVEGYIFKSDEWETAKQSQDTELRERIKAVYSDYVNILDGKITDYKEEYGIE